MCTIFLWSLCEITDDCLGKGFFFPDRVYIHKKNTDKNTECRILWYNRVSQDLKKEKKKKKKEEQQKQTKKKPFEQTSIKLIQPQQQTFLSLCLLHVI